jgi:hypothetical protein
MSAALVIFAAGCGSGGKHTLLDSLYETTLVRTASQVPLVTAVSPGNDVLGVPLNDSVCRGQLACISVCGISAVSTRIRPRIGSYKPRSSSISLISFFVKPS